MQKFGVIENLFQTYVFDKGVSRYFEGKSLVSGIVDRDWCVNFIVW